MYYGGHKAYLAGGYGAKCEYGDMFLTEDHLVFLKSYKKPVQQTPAKLTEVPTNRDNYYPRFAEETYLPL